MKANSQRAALLSSTSAERDAYFSFCIASQLIQPQFDRDIRICNRGSPGIRFLTPWVSRNANTLHCRKCSSRFHLAGSFDLFQGIGLHGDGMAIDEQNDRHHRLCLIRLLPSTFHAAALLHLHITSMYFDVLQTQQAHPFVQFTCPALVFDVQQSKSDSVLTADETESDCVFPLD